MIQKLTLAQIAQLVGGSVRGNASLELTGIAPLSKATATEIAWLSHPRFVSQLAASKAAAVLASPACDLSGTPAVLCPNIDKAIAQVIGAFAPPLPSPAQGIHTHASVDASAVIGQRVAIGPFVVVGQNATIGDESVLHPGVHVGDGSTIGANCRIWDNVVIREGCSIGNRVTIHPNTVVGADGFGYYFSDAQHNKIPHPGGVIIDDDVEIGACSCVDRSKTGHTRIGRGTKIDNLVQVAHNVEIGAGCLLCAQVGVAGSTRLGNHVVLGGQVGVRDNIVLNDAVMVAACSCVPQDVEAGARLAGIPATDSRQFIREKTSLKKLPELLTQIRELYKRVEKLEAATDDRPND